MTKIIIWYCIFNLLTAILVAFPDENIDDTFRECSKYLNGVELVLWMIIMAVFILFVSLPLYIYDLIKGAIKGIIAFLINK